jgi:HPt (histidine-containing phosphotransfer) domain-containing protein
MPLMNWSRLDEIREFDQQDGALLRKVVGSFIREAKSRIAAIERAVASDDAPALASGAHALKGAALNVGAAALADVCANLESWGREGRMDRAAASGALLAQRFAETAQALEAGMPALLRRTKKRPGDRRTTGRSRERSARRTR